LAGRPTKGVDPGVLQSSTPVAQPAASRLSRLEESRRRHHHERGANPPSVARYTQTPDGEQKAKRETEGDPEGS